MAEVGAGRGKHCGTFSPLLAAINCKNQYGSRCYVYELTQNIEESNSFVCTHVKNGDRRYQERIYLSINVHEVLGKYFSFAKAF